MQRKITFAVFLIFIAVWKTNAASINTASSGDSQSSSDKTSLSNSTGFITNETSVSTKNAKRTTNVTDSSITDDASTTYSGNTTELSSTENLTVEDDITNITETTVVTNITSYTNSTEDIISTDITDIITTVIVTNTTITTITIDGNETTIATTTLNSTDIVETTSIDDTRNATMYLISKNSSDVTTSLRLSDVSNKTIISSSTNTTTGLTVDTTNSVLICTSQGFIVDKDSTNCTTYIECIENENGKYTETKYTCPDNSLYNPDTTICDFDYECPTPPKPPLKPPPKPPTCTSQGFFVDSESKNCTSYVECIQNEDGNYTRTVYTCPDNSLYNPDTTICDFDYECPTPPKPPIKPPPKPPATFVCTSQGFFVDSESKNCSSYVECIQNEGGNYTRTVYICPDNSLFNPDTTICDFDYECPTPPKPPLKPSPKPPTCTSQGFFVDSESKNCSSYVECIQNEDGNYTRTVYTCPDNSLFNPNTTICDFDYECPTPPKPPLKPSPKPPTCTSQGFFVDSESKNCSSYVECIQNEDGNYTRTIYTCPDNSLFNPNTTICDFDYECPTPPKPPIKPPPKPPITLVCTSQGFFVDSESKNCSSYVECIQNEDGNYTRTVYTCPDNSLFNPNTTICDFDYECPTPPKPPLKPSPKPPTCTSQGFFVDSESKNCSSYVECIQNEDGNYTRTVYTCPDNSLFNPNTTICDFDYECPAPPKPPLKPPPKPPTTKPALVCTSQGFFVDSESKNCSSYVECIQNEDGNYTRTVYTCPDNSLFNPNTTICDFDYECPTPLKPPLKPPPKPPTCTSQGFFVDSESKNCTSYVECIQNEDGNYTQTVYTCPDNSLFNPNTTICDFDYECPTPPKPPPKPHSTNSTSICTSQGFFVDSGSNNCTTYVECIQNENGNYTETIYNCPENTRYNPDKSFCDSDYQCPTNSSDSGSNTFTCSSVGRFANSADSTCQTYYNCVLLSNGTYILNEYTCPSVSVFDPVNKYCTTAYACAA
ncbi:hypothetical protein PYW07_016105 [Mythimna separata]|uniref:Chitin-binding type-2 domain-containing protein n=1 Tax=Mythimna separata TaxID=271217 RepID=A0AAD7YRN7_MYTSE|nr:hypothetical protein PYW07_016105 [Mythimna separata]